MRTLILVGLTLAAVAGQARAWPALVSRAGDSISALLTARQQPASPQQSQIQQQPQIQQHQQQQPQQVPEASPATSAPTTSALPPHLQRLNGLVLSGAQQLAQANLSASLGGAAKMGSNVLEVLSNVGKAIQQQMAATGAGGPANPLVPALHQQQQPQLQLQPEQQQQVNGTAAAASQQTNQQQQANYREQGELLRQEILRRAGQLQQVVASSAEMMKTNGDIIVRRLLDQLGHRLDQAKLKADRIALEPATSEVAVRALTTINQGLNNVSNIVTNIVGRLEATQQQQAAALAAGTSGVNPQQRASGAQPTGATSALLLDPARLRTSLEQLRQQFSAAVQAAQQQRQLQQQQAKLA